MSRDKRDKAKRRRNISAAGFANKRTLRKLRLRDGGGKAGAPKPRPVWWIGPPFVYDDELKGRTTNPPK